MSIQENFPEMENNEEESADLLSSAQETGDDLLPVSQETVEVQEEAVHTRPAKRRHILRWCLGVPAGLILCFLIAFFGMLYILLFQDTRDWYVMMTYHTSNSWLATAFLPRSTVEEILNANKVVAPEGSTDPNLVKPVGPVPKTSSSSAEPSASNPSESKTSGSDISVFPPSSADPVPPPTQPEPVQLPAFGTSDIYPGTVVYEETGVQILKIRLKNTTARLIQVADPSRVFLGVTNQLGVRGQRLVDMCSSNDALCGINAGGFDDPGGVGHGGTPIGIVVQNSQIVYTDGAGTHDVVGFNQDNVLVLGNFTNEQILEAGIRDAMSWSPFLIVNGEKAQTYGLAEGQNPRSAIGQRTDGLVMMLVADGRQAGMPGADLRLMMDILYEYGAYNAANLDGGTSSTMVLNGHVINSICNPAIAKYGRHLPDGWMVRKQASE